MPRTHTRPQIYVREQYRLSRHRTRDRRQELDKLSADFHILLGRAMQAGCIRGERFSHDDFGTIEIPATAAQRGPWMAEFGKGIEQLTERLRQRFEEHHRQADERIQASFGRMSEQDGTKAYPAGQVVPGFAVDNAINAAPPFQQQALNFLDQVMQDGGAINSNPAVPIFTQHSRRSSTTPTASTDAQQSMWMNHDGRLIDHNTLTTPTFTRQLLSMPTTPIASTMVQQSIPVDHTQVGEAINNGHGFAFYNVGISNDMNSNYISGDRMDYSDMNCNMNTTRVTDVYSSTPAASQQLSTQGGYPPPPPPPLTLDHTAWTSDNSPPPPPPPPTNIARDGLFSFSSGKMAHAASGTALEEASSSTTMIPPATSDTLQQQHFAGEMGE